MFTKLVTWLCLLVALNYVTNSEAATTDSIVRPYRIPANKWVLELCGKAANPPACEIIARKCQYTPPPGPQETFCTCKDKVAGVKAIYSTWVQAEHEGKDICVTTPEAAATHTHSTKEAEKHVNFNEYLKAKDAKLDANLECCVAKARGLFDDSEKAILTAWQENTALIKDPVAKTAMIASLGSCQLSSKTCSYHSFMTCAMKGCYEAILHPAP